MGSRPYDVIVVGGGPAGCAAATTLARTGRSVLLATRTVSRAFAIGEGAPPGLDRAVDEVFGTGTFAPADHLRSLGNRAAWGNPALLATEFMFNPFGTGWHLDRHAFDAALLRATQAAGAVVARDATIDPSTAPVVIDASGRRAEYARAHGAARIAVDRLVAAVAVFGRADEDATTTVEAAEEGWWYSSPIPRDRRVVAFLTDGDLLDRSVRTPVGFDHAARRTTHLAALLGGGPLVAPSVVAADTAHLQPPCGDGWLAVGDAAASFDPLSSQGILTAVLMGAEAARCIDRPDDVAARYRVIIDEHERQRLDIYRQENRWPHAPFWARRHWLESPQTTSL